MVGVILAFLTQTRNRRYVASVWAGVGLAVAASALLGTALLLTLGGLSGRSEEASEGAVMWAAAGVLTYVLWWMGKQGRELAGTLRAEARAALDRGSGLAVITLVFLAVFREGAETVLYLAAAAGSKGWPEVAGGGAVGFGAAALAGYGIYRGGLRFLDLGTFFRVTTVVLLAFAAGLVGRATVAFQAVGIFPGTIAVWDTGGIVSDGSVVGGVLRALVGYTAAPSLLQVIFSLGYVALVLTLYREPYGARFVPLGRSYGQRLYRVVRSRRLTRLLPAAMGVALAFLVAVGLFGLDVGPFDNRGDLRLGPFRSAENENSLFNFVLWIVWLPLLTIGTLLLARVWCGNLCPLRLVSDWARSAADRFTGRGAAAAPSVRLGWLLPSAFILVTFAVKWLQVQRVALYGALFFLAVFGAAALVGVLFRRGTWCRYLCPVGGWLARIARLSPVALRPDAKVCASCDDKPCLRGTAAAGRCPAYLNPSRLETNQHCLACWACVVNCPPEKASLRLGLRPPGAELFRPLGPNLWESLFVASLLGMYMAVGHRSPDLASLPWPLLFFGLVAAATLVYVAGCLVAAPLAGIPVRRAVATFGYAFLPLEVGSAVIAFGDDALEFLGIAQPAAALLLALGFVWSVVLAVSILRNQSRTPLRAAAAAVPLGLILVTTLFVWLGWYASGAVVDVT